MIVKKNEKGFGIYSSRDYKRGENICVLKGKKRSLGDLYYHKYHSRKVIDDPLQIGEGIYIDLGKPYFYFNHSCNPNAGIRKIANLFAIKNIKKGEEITFDYSTTMDESLDCKCGARECRRAVVDFFALPLRLQKRYYKEGALPDFIKKKFEKLINKKRA